MKSDEGKHDVFVGMEHRLRSEPLQKVMIKNVMKRLQKTAHDARATDEGEEVGRNISGLSLWHLSMCASGSLLGSGF